MANHTSPLTHHTSSIVIYQAPDGSVALDVRLERETIWLTQKQMAQLFETERSVITKHLHNVFRNGELDKDSVCAFFAHTAEDGKTYRTQFYNLDAIISVGYRVNSRRGTQFRIWATQVLRDHILKGYSVNERRLRELQKTVQMVADIAQRRALSGDEAAALLQVVQEYASALDLLECYDQRQLPEPAGLHFGGAPIEIHEARQAIERLRGHFNAGPLFGRETSHGLESALSAVFQSAGGKDAYPSVEEKAAHLLYFLVKDHPFVDGNKRIASALLLWFLEKNRALYLPSGEPRIDPETLVALTLLVAESDPRDRLTIIRLIMLLITDKSLRKPSDQSALEKPGPKL